MSRTFVVKTKPCPNYPPADCPYHADPTAEIIAHRFAHTNRHKDACGGELPEVPEDDYKKENMVSPFERVYENQTMASLFRKHYYKDPQAPRDVLDFRLKACYNQHRDWWKDQREAVWQPETLGVDHGRIFSSRPSEFMQDPVPIPGPDPTSIADYFEHNKNKTFRVEQLPPCTTWRSSASLHPNNPTNNAIAGVHSQETNRGYSRKPDGGFFSSG